MTVIDRVRVGWSGGIGGPGVTTFYMLSAPAHLTDVRNFFVEFANYVPTGITFHVEASGDKIEDTTGTLVGNWVGGAVPDVVTSNPSVYAGPAGLAVSWFTDLVAQGRRVRGRTFIVPIGSDKFDAAGTLAAAALSAAQATAIAFLTATAGDLRIWHRPFAGAPAVGTKPARPAHAGSSAVVVGTSVRDKAAVLRSRRD